MADNQLIKWIEDVEKSLDEIKKLPSKDRLQTCASIIKFHQAIAGSLHGWGIWLQKPQVLDKLSEEELKETFDVFKKLAIKILTLDLKMSRIVLNKEKKKEPKVDEYVS